MSPEPQLSTMVADAKNLCERTWSWKRSFGLSAGCRRENVALGLCCIYQGYPTFQDAGGKQDQQMQQRDSREVDAFIKNLVRKNQE